MSTWTKIRDKVTNVLKNDPIVKGFTTPYQWAKDIADHNKHVADRQNKQALEAWQMQNEYNTPANQMQRLLDAGLNPNLAYSNVDTGNAKSAPNITNVGDKGAMLEGLIGHAFNAVQLMNSIQARKDQTESRQFQEQYQRDVLEFRKHQADVDNAFRMQQMAYNQSYTQRQYDNWMREFDERVRHNKAMEGKPTTMGMLDNVVYGITGRHTNDVLTSAGRLEKKYLEKALFGKHSPFGGIARVHGKYF